MLGRAHTIAAMDPTKLQTASGGDPQAASRVVTPAALSDSTAWKKQRPGAAFFEKLQVSFVVAMLWVSMHEYAACILCPRLALCATGLDLYPISGQAQVWLMVSYGFGFESPICSPKVCKQL